jgi:N-acetylglutamate synthase-like GNAT family acetyltransferase
MTNGSTAEVVTNVPLTVRDLRRRWKPAKERLIAIRPNHPTTVRVHRAFSWLARVEQIASGEDLDLALICRWVAFDSLYGQWDQKAGEPMPDRDCWRRFMDRVLALDSDECVSRTLLDHKRLTLALLDDQYLSDHFWVQPSDGRSGRARRAKFEAQTWFLERRWAAILDHLIDRIYLMRCQLMHGAATFGGNLNRDSLRRCSTMLAHLVQATLLVIVDQGADEDWGAMCYPPTRLEMRRPRVDGAGFATRRTFDALGVSQHKRLVLYTLDIEPMSSDTSAVESLVQIDSLNESQTEQLHEMLQREWGMKGRSFDDLLLMIQNSSLIIAFAEKHSGRLVACCRVLTDFVFQATVHGVIVVEDWRGRGLGQKLMDAVVQHPRLQRVRSIWLRCVPEMESFYAKWGFAAPSDGATWLLKQENDGRV